MRLHFQISRTCWKTSFMQSFVTLWVIYVIRGLSGTIRCDQTRQASLGITKQSIWSRGFGQAIPAHSFFNHVDYVDHVDFFRAKILAGFRNAWQKPNLPGRNEKTHKINKFYRFFIIFLKKSFKNLPGCPKISAAFGGKHKITENRLNFLS